MFWVEKGWEITIEENLSMDSVDRIVKKFSIPLRNASVDTDLIVPEFSSLVQYAVHFISLSTLDYRAVWWRIFHAPNASEWFNALALAKLLFSLPTSNAKVERAFSQMNLIKNNKRTLMANDILKDLLALAIDPVPLNDFKLQWVYGGEINLVGQTRSPGSLQGTRWLHQ